MVKKISIYLVYILASLILISSLTGCSAIINRNFSLGRKSKLLEKKEGLIVDPDPQATEESITLYFKHQYADLLVWETRTVKKCKQSLEHLVMEELLKGPIKHERLLVMPSGTKILSVTRYGETVFVDLSREFLNDIDLSAIAGKESTQPDDKNKAQIEMKKMAIYSIVNSITRSIVGVNKVKILVESRALSYEEMKADLLSPNQANLKSPMPELYRNKNIILSPGKSVEKLLNAMIGEPDWDKAYAFLASEAIDNTNLPPIDEFKKQAIANPISLELDGNPIIDEEIMSDGTAYVIARFTIRYSNGLKVPFDKFIFTVVNKEGIWKVRLPKEFNLLVGLK